MLSTRRRQLLLITLGLGYLLPTVARSTTFVLMDEESLLRAADAVVVGTVTGIESGTTGPDGAVQTYVHVQPDRIIKGDLGRDPLVLREPGGTVADHHEWVYGAPEFWVGERSLLFLSRNPDGTLQTHSLAMGKFTLGVDRAGHVTAVRDFGYGAAVLNPLTSDLTEAPTQTERYLPKLKRLRTLARTHPAAGAVELVTTPPELATARTHIREAFTYLGSPTRWFEPDHGQPVTYFVDSTGDSKLGLASSQAAIDQALAAWTNVGSSSLLLQDGGLTAPGPFNQCSINRIVFNDPNNEITDPSGCGGILAIGGYCGGGGSTAVNGTTFGQIVTGKLTFNNGWGGCTVWNACNVAEVATHEIGHTIGLGHSADATATMAAMAHFDGRCAGLGSDDVAAVSFIYPPAGSPAPTPTPTATRAATNTPQLTATMTQAPNPTATLPQLPTSTAVPTRTPTSRPTATFTPPATATRTFTPTVPGTAFPNDPCTKATVILANTYRNVVNTGLATSEVSDPPPQCGNGSRSKSVWYQFTAPSDGWITANTFGSSYITILSAYTGSCGALRPIAGGCSSFASGTMQSAVRFAATSGTTYWFMVSSYFNVGGSLVFDFALQAPTSPSTPTPTFTRIPPTPTPTATPAVPGTPRSSTGKLGEACTSAATVTFSAYPYSNMQPTSAATTDATDPYPACGNGSRGNSVWYQFTAPRTGWVTANTFGSSYNTILGAYAGSCGALVPVTGGCNDNSYSSYQSQVSFWATAGKTYYFMISAYFSDGGTLRFNLGF